MQIVIDDTDPEALQQFINFLYEDDCCTENYDVQTLMELLKLAHMYNVPRLLGEAEKHLFQKMSVENVATILPLAKLLNCDKLLVKAEWLFLHKKNDIIRTNEWKELVAMNPTAFEEFL